jgi:hypothetical protein
MPLPPGLTPVEAGRIGLWLLGKRNASYLENGQLAVPQGAKIMCFDSEVKPHQFNDGWITQVWKKGGHLNNARSESDRKDDPVANVRHALRREPIIEVNVDGRTFATSLRLAQQVNEFRMLLPQLTPQGATVTMHGDGLLPYVMEKVSHLNHATEGETVTWC